MKKIRKFINKYKNYILIFSALLITILFFTCIWFTQNNFSLYIKIFLLIYLIYMWIFELNKVEKILLNNMTYILLLWIIYIIYSQRELWISNKDILLMSWWIIAFWYWYKKYEIDKEISLINNLIEWKFSINNFTLMPWLYAYKMYKKNNIPKDYYNTLHYNNYYFLYNFIATNSSKDGYKQEEYKELVSIFVSISSLTGEYDDWFKKIILDLLVNLEKNGDITETWQENINKLKKFLN